LFHDTIFQNKRARKSSRNNAITAVTREHVHFGSIVSLMTAYRFADEIFLKCGKPILIQHRTR